MSTKKVRSDSWGKSFNTVGSIYSNARKSNKFVATFLIGIVFFSSLGIWIDIIQQLSLAGNTVQPIDVNTTEKSIQSTLNIDNFLTFIVAMLSILIIDSFLEPEEVRDELKGLGILFIGLTIIITGFTYYFNSLWIILAYILCLMIYITIEADKDKYDSKNDTNPVTTQEFNELEDED